MPGDPAPLLGTKSSRGNKGQIFDVMPVNLRLCLSQILKEFLWLIGLHRRNVDMSAERIWEVQDTSNYYIYTLLIKHCCKITKVVKETSVGFVK